MASPHLLDAQSRLAEAEAHGVDISIITTIIADVIAIKSDPRIATVGKLLADIGTLLSGIGGAP